MHASVMRFLREQIVADEIRGREVLEVGSQDVNGSPREALVPHGPKGYIGVDFAPGNGVDLVLDVQTDAFRQHFASRQFEVVVTTEMLEHVEDWRRTVANLKDVLAPGGLLVVTTRGPGFMYHGYPHDYWRYTVDDFRRIFADMWILHLEPDTDRCSPGVFLKARKTGGTGAVLLDEITVAPVRRY